MTFLLYGLKKPMDGLFQQSVKHDLVTRVKDWPYSPFHRYVRAGTYPIDWAGDGPGVGASGFGVNARNSLMTACRAAS